MIAEFTSSWTGLAPVLLVILAITLYIIPKLQVYRVRSKQESKGPLELENDYRQTLVQIFGGIVIVTTVYTALESARQSQKSYELTQKSYELTRQGQVADRTFKAMEMLSKVNNMDSKVAAIYALGEVADEVPSSGWQITETLFNYVRLHSQWSASSRKSREEELPPDISAITDYLTRRPFQTKEECLEPQQCWDYESKGQPSELDIPGYYRKVINLPQVDLHHAFFEGAVLKTANFPRAHLERAWFRHAHCENVYAAEAHFANADLSDSHWMFANLTHADLKNAQLCRAHFEHVAAEDSNLANADLEGSHWDASQGRKANLKNADLSCSYWDGVDMQDVDLEGAKLFGADLTGATHLTRLQLEKARGDNSTKLSEESLRPSSWSRGTLMKCPKKRPTPPCPLLSPIAHQGTGP